MKSLALKTLGIAAGLALGLLGGVETAQGYAGLGGKWQRSAIPVPYTILDRGDFPFGTDLVKQGAWRWSNNETFEFAYKYAGKGQREQERNGVYMSRSINQGVLGVTWPRYSGGVMQRFHMAFNKNVNWSRQRFLNVSTHEFGHALGLAHTKVGAAIMEWTGGAGEKRTELHSDDIAGARWLYPPRTNRDWGDVSPDGNGGGTQGGLAAPVLIAPKGTVDARGLTFTWQPVAGADAYEFLLDSVDANGQQTKLIRTRVNATSLQANPELAKGRYFWWVRAVKGEAMSQYAHAEFTVNQVTPVTPPPAKPEPQTPIGVTDSTSPTFTWKAAANAASYDFGLDKLGADGKQESILRAGPVTATELLADRELQPGKYFWWLRARNEVGVSEWAFAQFEVKKNENLPGKATPIAPSGDIETEQPTFTWSPAAKAERYELVVHSIDDKGNQSEVMRFNGVRSERFPLGSAILEQGLGYYWWIRASNREGLGEWSDHGHFNVIEKPLGLPAIISPKGIILDAKPTFEWSAVDGASAYELKVHSAAGGKVFETRVAGTTVTSPNALEKNQSYWFWIRAVRGDKTGEWVAGSFGIPTNANKELDRDRDGLLDQIEENTDEMTDGDD